MILFFLVYYASSNVNITKVLTGEWDISKFQLTSDGVEVPDDTNLFLNLNLEENTNYINGTITKNPKNENKNESIMIQLYQLSDSTLSVKFKQSNNSQEYLELVLLKINIGLDDMIIATGKTSNYTYSLNISPPSSAELITFNQNTNQVNIYKLNKKIYHRKLNFYHIAPFITTFIYTTIKFLLS